MVYALPHIVQPTLTMISRADLDSLTMVANSVSFIVPLLRSLIRSLEGKLVRTYSCTDLQALLFLGFNPRAT